MSYVLHLWEHPVPASVAEADRIQTRLSTERTSQNPKFIELAKRLTERYPCMTTLEDDDLEVAWSDGPLDGQTDSPVYSLGVQATMLGVVVPFVATTANALGLTVYDTQAAQVHLPSGKVLTLPGRAPIDFDEPAGVDELRSKAHVVEVLLQELEPFMKPHGFKAVKKDSAFKRKLGVCDQSLLFGIVDYCPKFQIELYFWIRPKLGGPCQVVADQNAGSGWPLDMEKVADMAGVKRFGDQPGLSGRSRVDSLSGLKDWAHRLGAFVSSAVVPIADKCQTVAEVDRLMNPEGADASPFTQYIDALVLAKAAGNPRYEALVAEWRSKTPAGYMQDRLNALVAALQTQGG